MSPRKLFRCTVCVNPYFNIPTSIQCPVPDRLTGYPFLDSITSMQECCPQREGNGSLSFMTKCHNYNVLLLSTVLWIRISLSNPNSDHNPDLTLTLTKTPKK
jgi:hypothetical protein